MFSHELKDQWMENKYEELDRTGIDILDPIFYLAFGGLNKNEIIRHSDRMLTEPKWNRKRIDEIDVWKDMK